MDDMTIRGTDGVAGIQAPSTALPQQFTKGPEFLDLLKGAIHQVNTIQHESARLQDAVARGESAIETERAGGVRRQSNDDRLVRITGKHFPTVADAAVGVGHAGDGGLQVKLAPITRWTRMGKGESQLTCRLVRTLPQGHRHTVGIRECLRSVTVGVPDVILDL